MTIKPLVVRFAISEGSCCVLCNPVQFADFEKKCVRVSICEVDSTDSLKQQPPAFCLDCIERLRRAARGVRVATPLAAEISAFIHHLRTN